MQELLEAKNMDLESRTFDERALLHFAAMYGQEGAVKLLLVRGKVNPEPKDKCARTPLWLAAKLGRQEAVRDLLETGECDINSEDINGVTPLHMAAMKGNKIIVREMLATGKADLWKRDIRSRTPMQLARSNRHFEVAKVLETASKHNYSDAGPPPPPYEAIESEISTSTRIPETDSGKTEERTPKRSLIHKILK